MWSLFFIVIVMLIAVAVNRSLGGGAAKARREHEQQVEQRIQQTVHAIEQEEAERNSGGWRPPSGPQAAPRPNIAPRVQPAGAAASAAAEPLAAAEPSAAPESAAGWYQSDDAVAHSHASSGEQAATPGAPMSGPQVVDLPDALRKRVLELMEQHHEVAAVRLVCDEIGVGILDAQKTVRTLAGLPSPF